MGTTYYLPTDLQHMEIVDPQCPDVAWQVRLTMFMVDKARDPNSTDELNPF